MARIPQRPNLAKVVQKVQSVAAHIKPPIPPLAAIQAGKERVQAALSKLRGGDPLRGGPLVGEFLETLMAGGEEGQELARQIADRVREEFANRRRLCNPLSELLTPFRSSATRSTFRRDVMLPARNRQRSSQQTSDGIDKFFPVIGKVLQFAESRLGPLTIGIAFGVEGGAGLGFEAGIGIAGLRHHCLCTFDTATVAIGTYAEAQGSVQIGVSQGIPEDFWSWGVAIDGSLSASYGVSAEGTISLIPVKIQRPSWDRPYIVEYECVGLGLSLGIGAPGGGVALGLTRTRSYTIPGRAS